jgi:hypothetical protein
MTDSPLHDRLALLRADRDGARVRYEEVRNRIEHDWQVNSRLTEPWWQERYKPHRRQSTGKLRDRTAHLLAEMHQHDLVFVLAEGDRALKVVDAAVRDELAAAKQQLDSAEQRLAAFERNNADELREEESALRARRLRDAINRGESMEDIRAALASS